MLNFNLFFIEWDKVQSERYERSVRKVSDLFFCENLMDFNEAPLHEATLNLHTHARTQDLLDGYSEN